MTREPELAGQTVVVIGGTSGIGLETARRARAEGAEVTPHGPQPGAAAAGREGSGRASFAAFDAFEPAALDKFFADLPHPIDHVMLTAGGAHYAAHPRHGPSREARLAPGPARRCWSCSSPVSPSAR